jgi:hypothetical protein
MIPGQRRRPGLLGIEEANRAARARRHFRQHLGQHRDEFGRLSDPFAQQHRGSVELQRHIRLQARQRHQPGRDQPRRALGHRAPRDPSLQDQAEAGFAEAADCVDVAQQAAQIDDAAQQALSSHPER